MSAATDVGRNILQEPDQRYTKAGDHVAGPNRDPRGD
jgi:hypothetical protein